MSIDYIEEVTKFNPYHDRLGRFAEKGGFMASGYAGDRDRQAVTFSANPDTKAGAMAIARESAVNHEVIGRAYGKNPPKTTDAPKKSPEKKQTKEKPQEQKPQSNNDIPSPTGNQGKSVLTQKALDKCREVEAKTVNRKTEKMTVIDDDGNITFQKSGSSGRVSFNPVEGFKMNGKTITHNHPGEFGGTFSGADVAVFTKFGLKSIRAVAKEGTYSLERTSKATPKSANEFSRAYQKHNAQQESGMKTLKNALVAKFKKGEISSTKANKKLSDERTKDRKSVV